MKKMVVSVLLALALASALGAAFFLCASPFVLLARRGVLSGADVPLADVVRAVCAADAPPLASMALAAALVVAAQLALFVAAAAAAFVFFRRAMRVFLPDDGYFRSFYTAIYAVAFFFPSAFGSAAVLLDLPVAAVLAVAGGFVALGAAFVSVMVVRVLPDSESARRRELFQRG